MKRDRKFKLKRYAIVLLAAVLLLQGVPLQRQGGEAGVKPCAMTEESFAES